MFDLREYILKQEKYIANYKLNVIFSRVSEWRQNVPNQLKRNYNYWRTMHSLFETITARMFINFMAVEFIQLYCVCVFY